MTDSPKSGKDSWYFNNSLLRKPEFSSNTKSLLFLLKTPENNHSLANNWVEYTKSCFKRNPGTFSKYSTFQENNFKTEKKTTKPIPKKKNKKKTNKPEVKLMIENLQDQFVNKKTNKQRC